MKIVSVHVCAVALRRIYKTRVAPAGGRLQAPRAPGLDVTLDPELVEKYRV